MASTATTGLTYGDLQQFPEDNLRRELIDGELIVTAAPALRHQRTVTRLVVGLYGYAEEHGGEVFPAPTDVYFTERNVVEPDVLFIRPQRAGQAEVKFVRGAPDVVVEVSSPSTRRLELVRKRDLYERFGVPEYWYSDLEADRFEVYELGPDGRYGPPRIYLRGERFESKALPGFVLDVEELLR